MNLKKIGLALLTVFVMGAMVADSASAVNQFNETGGQWYTGASPGTKLAVGTGTIDLSVLSGASFLTSTISESAIKFDSTSVAGETCSAKNPTSSSATIDCKALRFSGVTVSGPAATGCSTNSTITTKELTAVLGMNKAGTVATLKITPKAGAGTTFELVELTGTCANAGSYKVRGTVFAQAISATGVFKLTQEFVTNQTIQESAGTSTSLIFGENPAFLWGSLSGFAVTNWAGKQE